MTSSDSAASIEESRSCQFLVITLDEPGLKKVGLAGKKKDWGKPFMKEIKVRSKETSYNLWTDCTQNFVLVSRSHFCNEVGSLSCKITICGSLWFLSNYESFCFKQLLLSCKTHFFNLWLQTLNSHNNPYCIMIHTHHCKGRNCKTFTEEYLKCEVRMSKENRKINKIKC